MDILQLEKPLVELSNKINELKQEAQQCVLHTERKQELSKINQEIKKLEQKFSTLAKELFANLSPYQITQLSRHPNRPYTLDIANQLFSDFIELHGDRNFMDDHAIVTGLAQFNGKRVVVIGHQKGRGTKDNMKRNFGMPRPEGYRKALRVMNMAERFQLPIITFIDTPGAYPGIDAEERGQSEAIAKNIMVMSRISVPIVSIVVGEGGSGGALAIGVGNRMLMMEYSTYSVISPEGCASILWKDGTQASRAASLLGLTAQTALKNKIIDEIIPEPLGGAHWHPTQAIASIGSAIEKHLNELLKMTPEQCKQDRLKKIFNLGPTISKPDISPFRREKAPIKAWEEDWKKIECH
jgi:acetyl-CoA carboxylase carboxyl transferase subunit alpha